MRIGLMRGMRLVGWRRALFRSGQPTRTTVPSGCLSWCAWTSEGMATQGSLNSTAEWWPQWCLEA
jgi:hypothetical protein